MQAFNLYCTYTTIVSIKYHLFSFVIHCAEEETNIDTDDEYMTVIKLLVGTNYRHTRMKRRALVDIRI